MSSYPTTSSPKVHQPKQYMQVNEKTRLCYRLMDGYDIAVSPKGTVTITKKRNDSIVAFIRLAN